MIQNMKLPLLKQNQKKSSEFKKTLNWYGTVTAQMYHTFGEQQPGKKSEQKNNLVIPSNYFRKK